MSRPVIRWIWIANVVIGVLTLLYIWVGCHEGEMVEICAFIRGLGVLANDIIGS